MSEVGTSVLARWKKMVVGLVLVCGIVDCASAQTSTERIAAGLRRSVFLTSPPGMSDRLFIAEQGQSDNGQRTAQIKVLDRSTGSVLMTPFLEIGGLAAANEQGLLGMAFDPNYATNGYFYVNLTTSADGGDTHIRRYQVVGDPATSNVADPGSALEILSFNQPQTNHNGGWIGFGPNDDYLYIASGDGGGANDSSGGHTSQIGNAQDITNNLLGKMLRVDVGQANNPNDIRDDFPTDNNRNYAVPNDNPFVDKTGDDEIWAYGLRNPYRSSFDSATGDLWIGDVGQGDREEIDFQRANSTGGENYGWRLREGTIINPEPGIGGPAPAGHVDPIHEYAHLPDVGNVVIGGYVYRGPVAAFQGHYFFADSARRDIWKLDPDAVDPSSSVTRVNDLLDPDFGNIGSLSSFGEDSDGNLYLVEISGSNAEIFRVTTASQNAVFDGDSPTSGVAGDGTSWSQAANWTRGLTIDASPVDEDHVIFAAGASTSTVDLQANRTVSAATFEAPFTLHGNTLTILSGNVSVAEGITAQIDSTLAAETVDHSLRKIGLGTLLVNGSAGQTVVKQGTLGGTGTFEYVTVEGGATLAPGRSLGDLHVAANLQLEPDATLTIEVGGTGVGEFDQIFVDGTALLDGALRVELVDAGLGVYQPQAGDRFGILVVQGGAGGMFDSVDLPDLDEHLMWRINPGGVTVALEVNSTLAADFDNDADVDVDDLAIWEDGLGTTGGAGRSAGDADDDFDVDGADFFIWQQQFGTGAGSPVTTGVPEPNGFWLALAAGIAWCQIGSRGR